VYRGQFAAALTALAASFIDPATPGGTPASATSLAPWPGTGVFHAYGNGSGDSQNSLNTTDIFAHPSIVTDAEQLATPPAACSGLTGDAAFAKACLDNRVKAKVVAVTPVPLYNLTSGYGFNMYPNTDSPVPIIRNEELILLRAEANIGLGNIGLATQDIDYIRVNSGGIGRSTGLNAGNILDALLKQKRYSLLFEGGHRWIDARRYNKLGTLPIDQPNMRVQTSFPIPQSEVNARGG
jgi:hypothetical protein